jgi:hypothetical protein
MTIFMPTQEDILAEPDKRFFVKKNFFLCPVQELPTVIEWKARSMCPLIQTDKTVLSIFKLIAAIICFGLRMIAITIR